MTIGQAEANQIIERAREKHRAKLLALPGGSLVDAEPKPAGWRSHVFSAAELAP
jgi:hypothetical protein